MLTAIAVGLMLTLDPISLWLLLPMTFVSGTFGAVQNIARQSYAFDLAGISVRTDELLTFGFGTCNTNSWSMPSE